MFLNDWSDSGFDGMCNDFQIDGGALEGATILLASYTYENYTGDAFVLFERDGQLFEVNGSHCSCYGLEGQWEPEETTKDALLARDWYHDGCSSTFKSLIEHVLASR